MSTRKGAGATRTRKPKHQNTFAFRHNPKSQKTAKILASVNAGLCASCHDKVEWRKKYRKYRPLRQPATCNDCHKKSITSAYHKICTPCARERRVCPWCCTKGRPRETSDRGEDGDAEEGEEEQEPQGEGKEASEDGKAQAGGGDDGKGKAVADDSMQQEEEVYMVEEQAGAGTSAATGGGKSVGFASSPRKSTGDCSAATAVAEMGAAAGAAGAGVMDET